MDIRYVVGGDDGWLVVKYSDETTYPPLPAFLKVQFLRSQSSRDHFRILEGAGQGRTASVRLPPATFSCARSPGSWLSTGSPWHESAKVTFSISRQELSYDSGAKVVSTITSNDNPTPPGTHDLEIPDEVHALGSRYLARSPFATTWFRIGHSGDRYLHTGSVSGGCTTVTDVNGWTDLYRYLIVRRKGDGRSVGTLTVLE